MLLGGYVSITRPCLLIALINILGCEYIRPTLNVPLAQWNPTQGYRFGLRAFLTQAIQKDSSLWQPFPEMGCEPPVLLLECCRSWRRQPTLWEGKQMRLKGATLTTQSNVGKRQMALTKRLQGSERSVNLGYSAVLYLGRSPVHKDKAAD